MNRSVSIALLTVLFAANASAARFDFVALGDTAYRLPDDLPTYEALIEKINAAQPAFSIHVGDIWGANVCTTAEYEKIHAQFQRFRAPLIYTPGDNEWVDCRDPAVILAYVRYVRGQATEADLALLGPLRSFESAYSRAGYDDVLARLADIRGIFFSRAQTLGAAPMPVIRQADVSEFEPFVENLKWTHHQVQFATVNVAGSQNNFFINDARVAAEAVQRTEAAVRWIESTFTDAAKSGARAVVISMHAQLFLANEGDDDFGRELRGGPDGAFYYVARALRDGAAAFGNPVLLIHGDFHEFIIDLPFRVSTGETTPAKYDNITRLQVYGAPDIRAVRVSVDTDTPWVFGFAPLY